MTKSKKYILTLSVMMTMALMAMAQKPENILAAAGSPPNPKVPISWNRYHDNTALEEICRKMVAAHPGLVSMASIGKSVEGRELWMLTITDREQGSADRKPAAYIDGGIHANEIQGVEFALYIAWYVTEMHAAGNPFFKQLLAEKTFYIAPSINPDSRDHFIHNPNTQNSSRSGQKPVDNDRDGLVDEDDFDDLNGDGHITQMRRKSPYGEYVLDPQDPKRLIPAGEGQKGEYELLGYEGIDNDGDGLVNEDGAGGYDPNRDWGWNWQPNYIQGGAYKYPFSLPENRAVADFFLSHPNIGAAQSFHNTGGLLLRGPGAQEDEPNFTRDDIAVYDALGKKGEELIPGYRYIVTYKDLYSVYGGEFDWMHGARGVFAMSNELWNANFYFNRQQGGGRSQADQYLFDQYLMFGDGFVEWKPYNHPQYGEIEIGGFKKNYGRLHPGFLLESDAHRNASFVIYHAYHTPKVAVADVEVVDAGGGLKQVTAVIKNERIIPTHSAHDIAHKIEVPDVVSLSGGTVVAGMVVENRDLGITTEQRNDPANIKVSNIPSNGITTVRWLVKGGDKFTVTVDSKKGGTASKSL
ncbi:M14 family metallopeptidase [Parapedobacter koreensis]|uniref:Zinc carboxypeptidase n=1 Tax=Parapedobacter koreensis TaxID=332977 RepID=A0A1H7L3W4_9SPHI|nr:M14 family metallopeptidase [Parapedobacter koreensis]SEK93658.1 Zinc carboxypeptidase [Parapedobacter koreensis]